MRRAIGLAVFCVFAAGQARACSVPVFRYALERWKPSAYAAHVYHRGPLPAAREALARKLEGSLANPQVRRIDLAGNPDEVALRQWKRSGDAPLPSVVLTYPEAEEDQPPAWSGPLEEGAMSRLLDSPARRRIAKLLTRGESVVWVLITSGDRQADDAAAKLLDRELARLQKEIELPEQADADSMLLTSVPLKVSFPVVRLDRSDPEEDAFVAMLLASDEELRGVSGPVVFPVFGRGRALWALEGKTLTGKEVERAARFLCGACSCRVKDLNPGVDLLMSVDWDELLETPEIPSPPEKSLVAPPIPPGKVQKEGPAEPPGPSPPWWLYGGIGAGAVVVLLTGARALFARRPPVKG